MAVATAHSGQASTNTMPPGRTVAAPGFGQIDYESLPAGTTCEYLGIRAVDGGGSRGYLYARGGEKSVVYFMHPRGDQSRHYVMDGLLERGYATFGHNGRWLNNDAACIHEILLLDIAAGMKLLRERGYENIILLGNSGGGSLLTFYQNQALTPPDERLKTTPGGQPVPLPTLEMSPADGLILLAAHIGQGKFLMRCIDPSVVSEADPVASDSCLDMYHPDNGFREPPAASSYAADFIERFRAAQRRRVEQLDRYARSLIEQQAHFKALLDDPAFQNISGAERTAIKRRAAGTKVMTIYRTDAMLESCDLSLSPSNREVGSLVSSRPDLSNFALGGFAWIQTPHAWLSTWSGLSSRASLLDNIGRIDCPTLIIGYDGDNGVFPSDIRDMQGRSGAKDVTALSIEGDHYGRSERSDPRAYAKSAIGDWLVSRF